MNPPPAIAEMDAAPAHGFSQVVVHVDTSAAIPVVPAAVARTASVAVVPAPVFAPPATGAGAVGSGVLALLLVVSLILALAWLVKRMPGSGLGGGTAANPSLRVVGSLALGPRERVVVVAVGETQLLLSVGAGGTRTLHTLAAPLPVNSSAPSPFANLLAQHFGKKQ